jgi:hypothetical protein
MGKDQEVLSKKYYRIFIILLILFVAGRGIILLCVLPPFEGWDEYQHIAYIQYLIENNKTPVLNESFVPRSLISQVIKYPQPKDMADQLKSAGALDYQEFYRNTEPPKYTSNHDDIPLYQAQHGAFYYSVVKPLYMLTGGLNNLIQSVYTLRILNLVFILIALTACFIFLGKIVNVDKTSLLLILFLVSSQPLYLINAVRVSNDAIAILLGTFVIIWALQPNFQNNKYLTVLIGILLGFGIWAKANNLSLLLFVFLSLSLNVYIKKTNFREALTTFGIVLTTAVVVSFPNTFYNLMQYNSIAPMQEAIINQNNSKSFFELMAIILQVNLPIALLQLWLRYSTWIGGWSFLLIPKGNNIIAVILSIALLGWLKILMSRSKWQLNSSKSNFYLMLRCLFLVISVSIGLTWHMVQSYSVWGRITTNPWYASMAFPFALLLVYLSARVYSRIVGIIFGVVVSFLYLTIEWIGVFYKMIPTYSGGVSGIKALQRISEFHPPWLNTTTLFITTIWVAVILIGIIAIWFKFAWAEKEEFIK